MSPLINREKRARAKAEKGDRMRRILDEAGRAFFRLPYVDVTLDGIARGADVRQGQPALYFGSKEELFLRVVEIEHRSWCERVEAALAALPDPEEAPEVAARLASSLAAEPRLPRFLGILPVVLDQKVDVAAMLTFHHTMAERMRRLATAMESACPEMPGAVRLVARLHYLAAGLAPVAQPTGAGAMARLQEAPELQLDMAEELEQVLRAIADHP